MPSTQYKNIATELKDVDSSSRTVVVYVSKFGNIDSDGDMMMQGCYKKSISERGINGANLLRHLADHRAETDYVVGSPVFEEDSFGLKMTSKIRNTKRGDDILEGYVSKIWNQHSVMFGVPKGKFEVKLDPTTNQEYTVIYEAKLWEGSTVVWGANSETPMVGFKSFFKDVYGSDISKVFAELNSLTKATKTGNFSDDIFPLLSIKIKQLESIIEENFEEKSIVTAPEALQPQKQEVDFTGFFKELQNTFHTQIIK